MTKDEVYSVWNRPESVWSRWTKAVLFSYLEDGDLQTSPLGVGRWQVPTNSRAAILVDLPGNQGVFLGLNLCIEAGFRPIPIYNACPFASFDSGVPGSCSNGPSIETVVDLVPVMHGLVDAADVLRSVELASGAPPAFLIDSNRNGPAWGTQPTAGRFDNRSFVTVSDFPSAEFLEEYGLSDVILIQAAQSKIAPDVEEVLLSWQSKGITISRQLSWTDWNPTVLKLRNPSLIRRIWRRFVHIAGYKMNDLGWFGTNVPPGSS